MTLTSSTDRPNTVPSMQRPMLCPRILLFCVLLLLSPLSSCNAWVLPPCSVSRPSSRTTTASQQHQQQHGSNNNNINNNNINKNNNIITISTLNDDNSENLNNVDGEETNNDIDTTYQTQYGESFIGGDPCGSTYNTDPHNVKVEKPGMPDSMKDRIQFLVDQKKKQQQQQQQE